MREYRYLEDAVVEETGNTDRPVELAAEPKTAERYTVEAGDCLWTICRRVYGDGALAYQLATANNIANPDLIYPGQVLDLPDRASLTAMEATAPPSTPAPAETQPEAREAAREAIGLGGGSATRTQLTR